MRLFIRKEKMILNFSYILEIEIVIGGYNLL